MAIARVEEGYSYSRFLDEHLRQNEPCLFPASLVEAWPCLKDFISGSGSGASVDYAYLVTLHERTAGSSRSGATAGAAALAPVHRPSTAAELEAGYPPTVCDERSLAEVFALWQAGKGEGLYVKDWHLALAIEAAGETPFYEDTWAGQTADDWLNGWSRTKSEDFRFVYLGAAGTTTLLHRDVYGSYSISTNVVGRKRWHLFPPATVDYLFRDPTDRRSELIQDVRNVDERRFPCWPKARAECRLIEQEAGETIFVPSGWYHQVENLRSAISTGAVNAAPVLSINHNWANSVALLRMLDTLCADVDACAGSIDDVREMLREARGPTGWEAEWVQEVQDLVKRDAGWNWLDFWAFVLWGVEHSLDPEAAASQPPLVYIKAQVSTALKRMEARRAWELGWLRNVRETMERVRGVLETFPSVGTT